MAKTRTKKQKIKSSYNRQHNPVTTPKENSSTKLIIQDLKKTAWVTIIISIILLAIYLL